MADDPVHGTEFIVLEFDPRSADVSVLASDSGGMRHTRYSNVNRGDAVQDARKAADRAREAADRARAVGKGGSRSRAP